MRIGYCKIGQAFPLAKTKWGIVGGDDEPPLLLKDLALRHPEHEWVIIGRNTGETPVSLGLPDNVTNPWTAWNPIFKQRLKDAGLTGGLDIAGDQAVVAILDEMTIKPFMDLDRIVCWLGQHGPLNAPIPKVGEDWGDLLAHPYDTYVHYASYVIRGINAWRSRQQREGSRLEETYLIADARNYHHGRDAKWPITEPILGQYTFKRKSTYERYNDHEPPETYGYTGTVKCDGRLWVVEQQYVYSRLEICGVLPWHIDARFDSNHQDREDFGLFINEARKTPKRARMPILRDWLLPLNPAFVHGRWTKESLADLGVNVQPADAAVYYDKIRSVRCTFTTPSSGSGWATTKPWQAFAVGTVCFFHPEYDTQNNILIDADPALKEWLRVSTAEDLAQRVTYLRDNPEVWQWIITAQRAHYDKAVAELRHLSMIDERLGL